MKFLRTASTTRLLATLAGLVVAIAGGAAIAVAATDNGPVPRAKPLAKSLHGAMTARPVSGISADITFTNNLISSSNFTGDSKDPLLQGATGRLWWSKSHGLRLELQSDNGDSQVVVNGRSFWVSDKSTQTVYEGTLPAASGHKAAGSDKGVPTVARIQTEIKHLLGHLNISGTKTSNPGDIAGRPSYSVSVSPKHDGGLLGAAQIAWDAVTGTPLKLAVYSSNDSTNPVLELVATHISFGPVPASDVAISPPSAYKVVKISPAAVGRASRAADRAKGKGKHRHAEVTGAAAVARKVPFTLVAPRTLVGLPRHAVRLLDWGRSKAALVTYGQNLGGMVVIERAAKPGAQRGGSAGGGPGNLAMPTVSINGHTGTELPTALGTVLHYTSGGVAYTVLGSVPASAAERAAKALTP